MLNFGHTIGHAIESASNFRVSHGEAVSLGMIAAGKISVDKGILPESDYLRLVSLIRRAGLSHRLPEINISGLLEAINHDKKATAGKIKFVIANAIGNAVLSQDVNLSDIERVLLNWDETT